MWISFFSTGSRRPQYCPKTTCYTKEHRRKLVVPNLNPSMRWFSKVIEFLWLMRKISARMGKHWSDVKDVERSWNLMPEYVNVNATPLTLDLIEGRSLPIAGWYLKRNWDTLKGTKSAIISFRRACDTGEWLFQTYSKKAQYDNDRIRLQIVPNRKDKTSTFMTSVEVHYLGLIRIF